jgi:argonaute-like protein implicated in RNA metabolism and viral defense
VKRMNNMEMAFVNGKIQGRAEGKRQGAVEELERLVDEVKKKDYCQDFLYYSILKRLKELKEGVEK